MFIHHTRVYVKAIEVRESKFTGAIVPPHPVGRNWSCPAEGKKSIKSSSLPLSDFFATLKLWERQKGAAVLE